jgi:CRISPR system Cascade subunit CasD
MHSSLLIRLQGPMQSWGTRSRFEIRDTEREPTKSGVVGLLCAALGRDRSKPIADLVSLKMGVRVDREGVLQSDYQTVEGAVSADGSSNRDAQTSKRYYLADAAFVVALEGDADLLKLVNKKLLDPRWAMALGRKSYVPSAPVCILNRPIEEVGMRDALLSLPLIAEPQRWQNQIRLVLESSEETHEVRNDTPITYEHKKRRFLPRYVCTELVDIDCFPGLTNQTEE